MNRVSSGYTATGPGARDEFWTGLDDDRRDRWATRKRPPDWRVVAIIVVYGAVIFSVGLMLAA